MYIDPIDSKNWGEDLRTYQTQRKMNIRFSEKDVPKVISNKEVKAKETEFNPILQLYSN